MLSIALSNGQLIAFEISANSKLIHYNLFINVDDFSGNQSWKLLYMLEPIIDLEAPISSTSGDGSNIKFSWQKTRQSIQADHLDPPKGNTLASLLSSNDKSGFHKSMVPLPKTFEV